MSENLLRSILSSGKILLIDGAMGTALQSKNLTAKDFGGEELEGCNEYLVMTRPDVVQDIHEAYLEAGADIIETNTFGGTPLVLDEYGLGSKYFEINVKAVQLARAACEKVSAKTGVQRFVAGSMGPTTKAISVTGGITFEGLVQQFTSQAQALLSGGIDFFLIETCQDMRNVKACLHGIHTALKENHLTTEEVPIAVSLTIEAMGTMLAGQSVEAALVSLMNEDLLYIGLNCATGPEFMTDHIRTLAEYSPFPVGCVPNAGLPDEHGDYLESPGMVAQVVERFCEAGWINVLGGCCGTNAEHIRALRQIADKYPGRAVKKADRSFLSGIDFLEVLPENRPVLVGERTNVIGSKKFKDLICQEKFEEASEVARAQVRNGAQIIDLCLANPDRIEAEDMEKFMFKVINKVRVPLMIDSTDEKVIALALTYCQGKAIINSINLEDGEERFEKVVPLARKFGAALVVGTIDEDPNHGMGVTRARKLEIAKRSYDLLVNKYGVAPGDIYFDPLVFPCATGDAQYVGSAVETIEGIRLIKEHLPLTKTVLGISNVSFGLPAAGREVLNSVFLYHCVQAGLDLAIVNTEKLERYAMISEEEKRLSDDLIWNRGADPIAAFAAHFRSKKVEKKSVSHREGMSLDERLSQAVVTGSREGLEQDLVEALQTRKPLQIINGPLMKGMDEVGRLFNNNELIVAEVLQSAEVMKAAVAQLEPHMDKASDSRRGKVLLATVKGDVHDIGKNLVDIIFTNNGFEVVNLGIKIPPEQIIAAVREHQPDIIGLSGLLVKSAQQMVITVNDMSKVGVSVPVLVGGAALTKNFVDRAIAPSYSGEVAYAKDAMNGLELAKKIVDPKLFAELIQQLRQERAGLKPLQASTQSQGPEVQTRCSRIEVLTSVPAPPTLERHVLKDVPLELLWSFINPLMLYGRHLGLPGATVRKLQELKLSEMENQTGELAKGAEIWLEVEKVKKEVLKLGLLKPKAVYRYFKARARGNHLEILTNSGDLLADFDFPRQNIKDGLSLTDYVRENDDNVAFFVVTAASGVREYASQLKEAGSYLWSHAVQALALETAEAFAEYLHSKIRALWGFSDPLNITMMERFQAKYRGKRFSFGYPACPRLSDQKPLFDLLKPEDIGVELTDGYMMDPEASVSAIVFHHPQAAYFSVGDNRGGA